MHVTGREEPGNGVSHEMGDWPWLHKPGAMATFELNSARDKLSQALQGVPPDDPRRTALEAQLKAIVQEQESRRHSELASRGREA